jgi:hypothetical protein
MESHRSRTDANLPSQRRHFGFQGTTGYVIIFTDAGRTFISRETGGGVAEAAVETKRSVPIPPIGLTATGAAEPLCPVVSKVPFPS